MSGRLDGVQILRFVAAAMVLIQHAVFLPSVHYGVNTMPFRKLGIGTAGVYIFFVISGYVIAGLVSQPPLRFALHRIARIYPPYIASVVIGAALMILLGGITLEKIRWLWSFTLLPLGGAIDSWTYVPFWTLIYEMTFYAITMALMIFGKRAFDTGLIMWTARSLSQPSSIHPRRLLPRTFSQSSSVRSVYCLLQAPHCDALRRDKRGCSRQSASSCRVRSGMAAHTSPFRYSRSARWAQSISRFSVANSSPGKHGSAPSFGVAIIHTGFI